MLKKSLIAVAAMSVLVIVGIIIFEPFREKYELPFDAGDVSSVTIYCEEGVMSKELTEIKDINSVVSKLASLKLYGKDGEGPEETGGLDMAFEFYLSDGSVERIDYYEGGGYGWLRDGRKHLFQVSYFFIPSFWEKFKKEKTVIRNFEDYPEYETAQDLIAAADLVFCGTVIKTEYRMLDAKTDREPEGLSDMDELEAIPYAFTLYTVDVKEVYKGKTEKGEITVKSPGGIFGNQEYIVKKIGGAKYSEEETPAITEGEAYVFLAEANEMEYPLLVNPVQAVYAVDGMDKENEGNITLEEIMERFIYEE